MTYTFNMPFDGQSLGNSKPMVRDNFTVIASAFAVNHVAFNTATTVGMHKFVQMPNQGADPASGVAIGDLYTKQAQNYTNLFWKQESGGADAKRNQGAVIQMTGILPVNAAVGSTFLPGGLYMIWGSVLSGQTSGTFRTVFNFVTANGGEGFTLAGVAAVPWVIFGTPDTTNISSSDSWSITVYTTTTFELRTNGFPSGREFHYLAIGPKT